MFENPEDDFVRHEILKNQMFSEIMEKEVLKYLVEKKNCKQFVT